MVCDRVIKDHTVKKLSREKGPKWLQMPCSHMGDGGGGYDCLCSSNPNLRSLGLLALSLLPYSTSNPQLMKVSITALLLCLNPPHWHRPWVYFIVSCCIGEWWPHSTSALFVGSTNWTADPNWQKCLCHSKRVTTRHQHEFYQDHFSQNKICTNLCWELPALHMDVQKA